MIWTAHHREDGSTLLAVSGEVDMASTPQFRDAGLTALRDPTCHELVVDLLDVSFIDSTGLGTLIALRNQARDADKSLVLADPSAHVTRLLELTRLSDAFTLRHTGGGSQPRQ